MRLLAMTIQHQEKNMARKNKRILKTKSPSGLNSIQWAGIVVIVAIAAVAVWYFVIQPAQTSAVGAVPTVQPLRWAFAPPMTIDTTKQYFATVKMAKGGEFVIQLYANKAPITVNSFVFLANQGFYNGTTFHRVIDGFMAQGGDPTGAGSGGPGYQFVNEKNDLAFDKAGVVAMANAGPNTNGSQFFITFAANQLSESDYTIFGQVISGMDVVNGITRRDPTTNPSFTGDAMASVTISTK
jgi:peptidylprolyl isomerase